MKRLTLAMLLLAGCAQVHERGSDAGDAGIASDVGITSDDAASRACLPDGVYTIPIRLVSTSPSGCVMPMVMPGMLRLPPQASDFSMMCPMPTSSLVPIGACAWSIDNTCVMPDGTITIHVYLDGHAPLPTGNVNITIASGGGTCSVVVALGS